MHQSVVSGAGNAEAACAGVGIKSWVMRPKKFNPSTGAYEATENEVKHC